MTSNPDNQEMVKVILEFISDELLEEEIDLDEESPLFSNQTLDSMSLSELIAYLESSFSIRIGAIDIIPENFDTVTKITEMIKKKLNG